MTPENISKGKQAGGPSMTGAHTTIPKEMGERIKAMAVAQQKSCAQVLREIVMERMKNDDVGSCGSPK